MSAIFCDGFDTYANIYEKWEHQTYGGNNPTQATISTAQSRNGGQSLRLLASTYPAMVRRRLGAAAHAKLIVHFAVRRRYTIGQTTIVGVQLRSDQSSNDQTYLGIGNDGSITIYRGSWSGTIVATSSGGIVAVDTWTHIAWASTLGTANGAAKVWIDGVLVLNAVNIDTRAYTSYTTYDTVVLLGMDNAPSPVGHFFDDVVVLNGAGATHNDYLGDVQVYARRPVGVGDRTQLVPTGAANNWENVDEPVHNSVDFNSSPTAGNGDLYQFDNVPAATTVHFVQQTIYARKDGIGPRTVIPLLKSGGTEYRQPAVGANPNFAPVTNIYAVDPNGDVAWTPDSFNSLQAGVEVG